MSIKKKLFNQSLPKIVKHEIMLEGWDIEFKTALEKGEKVDDDLFDCLENEFDKDDW